MNGCVRVCVCVCVRVCVCVLDLMFVLTIRTQSFTYQEDLYPPTWDLKPVGDASAWCGGAPGRAPNMVALPPPPQQQ